MVKAKFNQISIVLLVSFFSVITDAKPMWEIADSWTCQTAFQTTSDKYGNGLRKSSPDNIETIDFRKGTITKYLSDYQRTLRGTITKKFYLDNKNQGVYESHWFANYEGIGNVSSGALLRISNSNQFYKGKLAINTQNGNVYGNAEICTPSFE